MQSTFVSHGAPTIVFDEVPARTFLQGLGERLGRPRAIVVVSGHWETEGVEVLATPQPETIHDFFGFPQPLYELRYAAPGAEDLARILAERLAAAGLPTRLERRRGLDHGVWVPLRLMYPQADIPVTQISICPARPAEFHWRIGAALADLGDDILLLGSGSLTHNLGDFRLRRGPGEADGPPAYVADFCEWIAERVSARDLEALLAWESCAPQARRAHPSPDHFLPFHVALGAAGQTWTGERLHHSTTFGVIAMDCYRFTAHGAPQSAAHAPVAPASTH